ncbi:MAG: TolC family protein [Oligoflexales bacterium]|nr:TolC family protein [Oligoflexales bacterium]
MIFRSEKFLKLFGAIYICAGHASFLFAITFNSAMETLWDKSVDRQIQFLNRKLVIANNEKLDKGKWPNAEIGAVSQFSHSYFSPSNGSARTKNDGYNYLYLNIDYSLTDYYKTLANADLRKSSKDLAKHQETIAKLEYQRQMAFLYFKAIHSLRYSKILDEKLTVLNLQMEKAKSKEKIGLITKQDLELIDWSIKDTLASISEIRRMSDESLGVLYRELEYQGNEPLQLEDISDISIEAALVNLNSTKDLGIEHSINTSPRILFFESKERVGIENMKQIKREGWPNISLFGEQQINPSPNEVEPKSESIIGLKLSWQIKDYTNTRYDLSAISIENNLVATEKVKETERMTKDATRLRESLNQRIKIIEERFAVINSAKKRVDTELLLYRSNQRTIEYMLDALKSYSEAKSTYLEALIAYFSESVEFHFVLAKDSLRLAGLK